MALFKRINAKGVLVFGQLENKGCVRLNSLDLLFDSEPKTGLCACFFPAFWYYQLNQHIYICIFNSNHIKITAQFLKLSLRRSPCPLSSFHFFPALQISLERICPGTITQHEQPCRGCYSIHSFLFFSCMLTNPQETLLTATSADINTSFK